MRKFVVALAAGTALVPLPALAQDAAEDSGLARAAEEMRDPVRQEQVAVMAEAVIASLLEMPVGNLLRSAAEIAGEDPEEIDPNTTLREAAGPGANEAPRLAARAKAAEQRTSVFCSRLSCGASCAAAASGTSAAAAATSSVRVVIPAP